MPFADPGLLQQPQARAIVGRWESIDNSGLAWEFTAAGRFRLTRKDRSYEGRFEGYRFLDEFGIGFSELYSNGKRQSLPHSRASSSTYV